MNESSSPLISVVVPIYNKEETIHRCVDSISGQTYKNIEIILVDDGSKDNSLESCKELEKKRSNIFVYSQENKGVSAARNLGIKKSNGSILTFVDADDWLQSDMIEQMMARMKEDVDIVSCCCYAVTEDRIIDEHFFSGSFWAKSYDEKKKLYFQLFDTSYGQPQQEVYTGIGVPWAKLYRKKLFEENELFFDERLSHLEDNVLNLELFILANKVVYLDTPLYFYSTDHIQTVLKKYNAKIVTSYSIASVLRYRLARKYDLFNDPLFKDNLDKETIILLNIAIINMVFHKERNATAKQVCRELKIVNEEIGVIDVLGQIHDRAMPNYVIKTLYYCLKKRWYRGAYALLKCREIIK